jgi:hypothetical protein
LSIISFCETTITVRIRKSVFPKELFERILFKAANNIWLLGKNNFDWLGHLPLMLGANAGTKNCLIGVLVMMVFR